MTTNCVSHAEAELFDKEDRKVVVHFEVENDFEGDGRPIKTLKFSHALIEYRPGCWSELAQAQVEELVGIERAMEEAQILKDDI